MTEITTATTTVTGTIRVEHEESDGPRLGLTDVCRAVRQYLGDARDQEEQLGLVDYILTTYGRRGCTWDDLPTMGAMWREYITQSEGTN